ncbi:unnamed protein product [Rotaria sp. Silwood2]|nr:unnamed protein product [Rotaria sp. Silwood2]CAF2666282.1 unnamed protein product [Rotaria sp. Silwood2]CAF2934474.1 unnamed protein product [Rotaria sp. Silwood2]CAF3085066.1 unnamed protein product [Rotaria sp. Silwood2]CAF4005507.1 unnamed protein product [Rotaria sp. Silwood2]
MLWWHLLFCIISIHRIVYFVRSQDEDEESTTVPLSTTVNQVEEQLIGRVSLSIPTRTVTDLINNGSQQNVNLIYLNESSKQRIIIALAVLCAALVVLLGFLVSIIVCQWLQHDRDEDDSLNETSKAQTNLADPSYNYHNHIYRQTVKL